MKPVKLVVKVKCVCGHAINIRTETGVNQKGVQCWQCGRSVWFVLRGWMRADGKCRDRDGRIRNIPATVISQE